MDDIQRKLTSIDTQLTGLKGLIEQILNNTPLFLCATGLIAGILIQNTLELTSWIWLIFLLLLSISTVIFYAIKNNEDLAVHVTAYITFISFMCLGAIRLTSFYHPRPDDIRNLVTSERKLATIRGLIVTEPYTNNYGYTVEPNQPRDTNEIDKPKYYKAVYKQWKFAKFMHIDPSSSFYLDVKEVKTVGGWAKTSGTVRVQVDEPVLGLKVGDFVQIYCWLDRFKPPTNPGQFNTAEYLARKNIFIAASVKSRNGIEVSRNRYKNIFTQAKRKIRERTTQALLDYQLSESTSSALLQALLLGYRGDIDSATYEAFRTTGLLHFISLSGMHLGILIGIIWWLCKTTGLMKHTRAIICIIAIGVFLLIVPPRAPTIRAAIIGWVFCLSFLFRRRFNSLNTLSLAAIILLLIRPTQLFEPGWQLSFASVLGLLLLCERIHFFLYEKIMCLSWRKAPRTKPFYRIISRPGPYLLRLFSTGLTAWLGGAGILLYHFYTINPFTSIWTVAVFPFVALILTIGYLKIILSFLLPTVALGLGIIVTGLCYSLIWIVERFARLDLSQILIGHIPLTPVILYYSFILFAAFAYLRRPLLKKAICTVMALAIIIFLVVTKWQRMYRDNLVITCLDVGHGQAILAQLPGKVNILFDAGSMHGRNIGKRIVVPFLDYSGINNIDAIIISHNDIDHINGIPEIVERCEVDGVYANDAFFMAAEAYPNDTAGTLKTSLNKQGHKIQPLKYLNLGSKTKIRILWPSEHICRNEELSDNDKSVVSLIEFAGRKILLCSDIENFAQQELLRIFPNLKAEIVVVPHHGLAKTLGPSFLESLNADTLICSCGRSQYEGAELTLDSIITNPNKSKLFYTAKDGTITIRIGKDSAIKTTTFAEGE